MALDRCEECGFDPQDLRPRNLPVAIRSFGRRVRCARADTGPDETEVDWEGKVATASPTLEREAVADDLDDAADSFATTLAELNDDEWRLPTITGRGQPVTVADLATMAVHEGSHHLLDVGRVLRSARGR